MANEEPVAAAPADAAVIPAVTGRGPGKSISRFLLEVVLIGAGVFLGLAGEQWRENAQHRRAAEASLRRFRAEIVTNRKAVLEHAGYHATLLESLRDYLGKEHKTRNTADVHLKGLRFVAFEQTAWDLALATQSLNDLDSDLAFSLSRVYNYQRSYTELTRGMTQAMYLLPWRENFDAFAGAAEAYYSDVVYMGPNLVKMYDELTSRIDATIPNR